MSEKLEWVSNDWAKPNYQILRLAGGGSVSVESQKQWRSQFIEGEPQPTEKNSASSLKAMGLVGLYRRVK
jgi:hypothetical protein